MCAGRVADRVVVRLFKRIVRLAGRAIMGLSRLFARLRILSPHLPLLLDVLRLNSHGVSSTTQAAEWRNDRALGIGASAGLV